MSKYTPGPWIWHEQGDANAFVLLTSENRWVIAFYQNGELMPEWQRANARLISAAPELLESLQEILRCDGGSESECFDLIKLNEARSAAKKAIAKATMEHP